MGVGGDLNRPQGAQMLPRDRFQPLASLLEAQLSALVLDPEGVPLPESWGKLGQPVCSHSREPSG